MPILRAELEGLVEAGATFIQIDDPSPAIHPDAPSDFAALFNAAVEPVVGQVRLGAHLCFGNYLGRPLARRTYRPVLDAMLRFAVDELVLEFANREMAEVEILGEIAAAGRDVAAGVIDVKNYHLESADEVAERTEAVLAAGVPAERLTLVPDCGFSQTARWATRAKLRRHGRRPRPGPRSRHGPDHRRSRRQRMDGHRISMLGTGLIGDFYTMTLHGQRGRDRVRVVYSRSEARGDGVPRALGRSPSRRPTWPPRSSIPTPTWSSSRCPTSCTRRRSGWRPRPARPCCAPSRSAGPPRRRAGCSRRSRTPGVFGGYLEDLCYTPKTLKAIAAVEAGAIGDVTWVRSRETHPGPALAPGSGTAG